ncbi:S-layer homology domain-containing protein [Rossellomorea aquimaris]|uniref:S-layer homology domain-containing protein n=1 Tax=Rossellomorea TaxID=2837508 RepID=UPI00165370E0|nr:S-layer homology domain-containing protein [Rossellomorea vietnamensis]
MRPPAGLAGQVRPRNQSFDLTSVNVCGVPTCLQMAVMIHRAFKNTVPFNSTGKRFTDVPSGYWAEKEINQAAANEIIRGYDTLFKPRNPATRAQGIVMIHRALRQETSSLPAKQEIIILVTDHLDKERLYWSQENYDSLRTVYESGTSGY